MEKSVELLLQSEEMGDINAMCMPGVMYELSEIVEQSTDKS